MVEIFSLPEILGRRIVVETATLSQEDKLLDWNHDIYETDIWLLRRIHIIISNERQYRRDRRIKTGDLPTANMDRQDT